MSFDILLVQLRLVSKIGISFLEQANEGNQRARGQEMSFGLRGATESRDECQLTPSECQQQPGLCGSC